MSNSDPRQVLSRLPEDEFFDREAELAELYSLATAGARTPDPGEQARGGQATEAMRGRRARNALVLGAPRVGKTELLRKTFDRLFGEGAQVVPFYYGLSEYSLDAERFARDYLSQFLAQLIAFRRDDARLIAAADEPLAAVSRAAAPEDYLWVRGVVDSFNRALQSGDIALLVRCALRAPAVAASRAQIQPFVMIDNFHLLSSGGQAIGGSTASRVNEIASLVELRAEFMRALSARDSLGGSGAGIETAPAYALCGLRRPMVELIPPDKELFDRLEMIRVEPMAPDTLERLIRLTAARLRVPITDSTTELMIQQLNHDLFYLRALLDHAASRRLSLKTFMEFERVYTEEVLGGRISHYLGAVLRDIAPDSRSRRAALEALGLVIEASSAVPIDAVIERMGEFASEAEALLARLHSSELLEISYGFVSPPADPVLADYVRAKYRTEIAGARRPVAGEQLLGEKLKHSYRLMMSRYNRAAEAQLIELLSRFDFQNAPASLFDYSVFDSRYRAMSRVQIRRSLEEEQERVRLPQIVMVNDAGATDYPGVSWRLFAASGFEGGIYSEANEALWLIALINSKEPLDVETLNRIDQRLESAARGTRESAAGASRVARWYISKEGFSAVAGERLSALRAYRSTYAQLDLLYDHLLKLASDEADRRPASEFELIIPIEDEAELIAARTVEQIARAADFDQEAINQIKTALIEACINAAEHSDSPDRRIYQRFALGDDRLIITVSNKGKAFAANDDDADAAVATASKGRRGRGLQIIRALMDEVRFERTDDGTRLVMTKFLKRPEDKLAGNI
jgi:serine/threonine-protein kinase RsbW